jgi:hypothetical protein
MLFVKSKPEDVVHHIAQMETLLLLEKELEQINQILSLEKLTGDPLLKLLIKEDLKDDKWIEDTNVLISTCYNKINKNNILKNHIKECKNFMVFRYMEEKCSIAKVEAFKQLSGWIFNEVDKKEEKSRWVSQKFLRAFEFSDVPEKFIIIMEDNDKLDINLSWLHKNRDLFFSEKLFKTF